MAGVVQRQRTETQVRSMDWLLMEVMVNTMGMWADALRVGITDITGITDIMDTLSTGIMDTLSVGVMDTVKS